MTPAEGPSDEPAEHAALTHLDEHGSAHMVEVAGKQETARVALARGRIELRSATLLRIREGRVDKGEVFSVARLAAIQAVKRTADLIPLCHPLRITGVEVRFTPVPREGDPSAIDIEVRVSAFDRTGVEMEALTAVSVAALTIYDMCKAIDRGMCITEVRLLEKHGGRSGTWRHDI